MVLFSREYLAAVVVYYETLDLIDIKEVPLYTMSDFASKFYFNDSIKHYTYVCSNLTIFMRWA